MRSAAALHDSAMISWTLNRINILKMSTPMKVKNTFECKAFVDEVIHCFCVFFFFCSFSFMCTFNFNFNFRFLLRTSKCASIRIIWNSSFFPSYFVDRWTDYLKFLQTYWIYDFSWDLLNSFQITQIATEKLSTDSF